MCVSILLCYVLFCRISTTRIRYILPLLLHLWKLIAHIWPVSPYIFSSYCCSSVVMSLLCHISLSLMVWPAMQILTHAVLCTSAHMLGCSWINNSLYGRLNLKCMIWEWLSSNCNKVFYRERKCLVTWYWIIIINITVMPCSIEARTVKLCLFCLIRSKINWSLCQFSFLEMY